MNLIKKILIAAGCAAALSACRKNDPQPDDYISFKVNGAYRILKPDAYNDYDGTFLLDAGPFLKGEMSLISTQFHARAPTILKMTVTKR